MYMCSFDIESLFTNLPLEETINIYLELLFADTELVEGMTKNEFRKLLEFTTSDTLILFNNDYYKQIDGVSMGSPLGPVLADIFLCHMETKWLNDCPDSFKPVHYQRYVDDIFLMFNAPAQVNDFLQFMNNRHDNIRFTIETEKDNKLPFLDILVSRGNGCINTNIYRKSTFSGVYSNFKSFIPPKYKANLVATLLYRIYHLTSKDSVFKSEVDNIEKILINNGYPIKFICICVKRFLKNKDKVKLPLENPTDEKKLIIMPFLGRMSSRIERRIKGLFRKSLPTIKLRFVYKTANKMCTLFQFKDRIPEYLQSDLVYLFTCGICNDTRYVGVTRRHYKVRTCEHSGTSPRTGKPLSGQCSTGVRDHMLVCDHRVTHNDFKVLSRGGSPNVLEIKESLLIEKIKPNLNKASSSTELFLFK